MWDWGPNNRLPLREEKCWSNRLKFLGAHGWSRRLNSVFSDPRRHGLGITATTKKQNTKGATALQRLVPLQGGPKVRYTPTETSGNERGAPVGAAPYQRAAGYSKNVPSLQDLLQCHPGLYPADMARVFATVRSSSHAILGPVCHEPPSVPTIDPPRDALINKRRQAPIPKETWYF